MFAFETKDLSTDFILSRVMEENEKEFYQFQEEPEEGVSYIYDGREMILENMEYLNGYADVNNNSLVSVNLLAKLIFHKDVKKTGTIKPLSNEEIDEELVKKLVNHQVYLYRGLDPESYYFFFNLAKEEVLKILTAETEEEALEIINDSLLFTPEEKKAANNVYKNKEKYFCTHLTYTIVEEALNTGTKIGELVSIREGIFEKRYKLHPAAVLWYINFLIEKAAQLEKEIITNPLEVSIETIDTAESIREKILKLLELDPKNEMVNRNSKRYVKYLYARKVLNNLGIKRLEDIDTSRLNPEWDEYIFMGFVKMFVENIDMNILTFTISRKKLDKKVKAFAVNRIYRVFKKLKETKKSEMEKIVKKYNYKKETIRDIMRIGKELERVKK